MSIELKEENNKLVIQFEKNITTAIFNTRLFPGSFSDKFEGQYFRKSRFNRSCFDIRNKKDYEILEGLLTFGESLAKIKDLKELH